MSSQCLRVRPACAADSHAIRRLWRLCIIDGPNSPVQNLLVQRFTHPSSGLVFLILLISILIYFSTDKPSTKCLSLTTSAAMILYFLVLQSSIKRAFERAAMTVDDMKNIAEHYGLLNPIDGDFIQPPGPNGFWVAEISTPAGYQIVGFIGLDNSTTKEDGTSELRRCAVSPYQRRRGIAGALMQIVLAHAKRNNIPSLVLMTTDVQPAAQKLYERNGWKAIEFQKWVVVERLGITIHKIVYHLDLRN